VTSSHSDSNPNLNYSQAMLLEQTAGCFRATQITYLRNLTYSQAMILLGVDITAIVDRQYIYNLFRMINFENYSVCTNS
jgi:hypothetical protein